MDAAELRRGHRLRHPARRAVPAPHGRSTTSRTVPRLLGLGQDARPRRARMELLERVGLEPGVRRALPAPALRRPAAARRRRPGAGRRPAGDAHGRAVQRGRPGRARAAAGRVPAAAGRARQDDRLRHPRHRRGDQARRPGRGAAGRRQASRRLRRPGDTCSRDPYDDFVADFVGRDRGYRGAGLPDSAELAAGARSRTVDAWASGPPGRRGWVLVVDDEHRSPLGWVEPRRLTGAVSRSDDLHRGGTVATIDGSLRAASTPRCPSPSGRGVIVDDDGALLGTVTAAEVLAADRGPAPESSLDSDTATTGRRRPRPAPASTSTSPALPLVLGLLDRDPARLAGACASPGSTRRSIVGTGLLYTIPSLALFILMPRILGTGFLDPVNVWSR